MVRLQEHQTVSSVFFSTMFMLWDFSQHSMQSLCTLIDLVALCLCLISCANDSSYWMPLPANSTEVTIDSHINEENYLESQVMFGHLENTLAVRCLTRNEMATVSREVKLVSNGKIKRSNTTVHPFLFSPK